MLHIISPRGISPRQRRLFYPFSSALALFYYAAAFTSGTRLSISTQYVVLLVTNIITINRHRISPVYRNSDVRMAPPAKFCNDQTELATCP
ncbi:hypothetical protein [Escherichia coli]|uniref:hypothetical protein n=1 Tax=Escherichia coli TaxID=562 RepID=UPI000944C441|nr:hypothetical protein [Escherichia coli]